MDRISFYSSYLAINRKERLIQAAHSAGKIPLHWNAIDNKFVRIGKFFKSRDLKDDFDCIHWTLSHKYWSLENTKDNALVLFQGGPASWRPLSQSALIFQEQLTVLHQFLALANTVLDLIAKEVLFYYWQRKLYVIVRHIRYSEALREIMNRKNFGSLVRELPRIPPSRASQKISTLFNRYLAEFEQITALRNLYLHNSLPMFIGNNLLMPKKDTRDRYQTYMNNREWGQFSRWLHTLSPSDQSVYIKPLPNYFSDTTQLIYNFLSEVHEAMLIG